MGNKGKAPKTKHQITNKPESPNVLMTKMEGRGRDLIVREKDNT